MNNRMSFFIAGISLVAFSGWALTSQSAMTEAVSNSAYHTDTPHRLLIDNQPAEALAMLKQDPTWIEKKDEYQRVPLHIAAQHGHVEVVKWLLENGADVNSQGFNNSTPLHVTSDPKVFELILANKPNIEAKTTYDQTVLQRQTSELKRNRFRPGSDRFVDKHKIKNGKKICKLLLEHGANYDLKSAIILEDMARVKAIFGADPKLAHRFDGHTPLRTAADMGNLDLCKFLIQEHNVDINDFEGGVGFPILKSALPYPKIVNLLIENNVDLETRITWKGGGSGIRVIYDNATALHFAARDGVPETIELLIDAGVPVLASTEDSLYPETRTALDVAAIFGRTENAMAILTHSTYRKYAMGKTGHLDRALTHAVHGDAELVTALLDAGADPNSQCEGVNAVQIATSTLRPNSTEEEIKLTIQVVNALLQAGAELDLFSAVAIGNKTEVARILTSDSSQASARRHDGYPAFHFAAAMKRTDILDLLLENEIDLEIKNASETTGEAKETALQTAIFWGHHEIADYLLDKGAEANAETLDELRRLKEKM